MTETLLAIDPGHATGISLWFVDDDVPMQRVDFWLVQGGLDGMLAWMADNLGKLRPDITVCERFQLDGRTPHPDLTPVYIEGALAAIYDALALESPIWSATSQKALCNDTTLRNAGLWLTGKDVGWTDAADVLDSCRHALAWARETQHECTLEAIWPDR